MNDNKAILISAAIIAGAIVCSSILILTRDNVPQSSSVVSKPSPPATPIEEVPITEIWSVYWSLEIYGIDKLSWTFRVVSRRAELIAKSGFGTNNYINHNRKTSKIKLILVSKVVTGIKFYRNTHIRITNNNIFKNSTKKSASNHRRFTKVPLYWAKMYFQVAFFRLWDS